MGSVLICCYSAISGLLEKSVVCVRRTYETCEIPPEIGRDFERLFIDAVLTESAFEQLSGRFDRHGRLNRKSETLPRSAVIKDQNLGVEKH